MLGKTVIVLMILLLLEPLFLSCTNDEDDDDDDDSAAMAKLAAAFDTKPPGWSANSSSSACTWRGVGCTGTGSIHIVSIMLESKSLSGTLPSPFPSLPNLYYLDLSDNNLSGEIPSLASLKSLEFLYLRNNCFTSMAYGFFLEPPVKLVVLDLSDNSFLVPWTIPKELSRLESLKIFRSLNSNVIGNLPDVFHFRFLETFSLSHNSLNGSLPPSLGGSSIANLELDHQKMKLSGNIQVLSTMSKLYRVDLEGNQFTGPIPDLSKCKDLRTLLLGNNQLTGLVPDSLGSLSLDTISLSGNKLQGPLPAFLLDNFLLNATLDGNNFCTNYRSPCDPQVDTLLEIAGAFDYPLRLSDAWKGNDACQNWAHVKCNPRREVVIIDMGKQYFCGTMSPAFSSLRSLQYLYLNDNNLTGFIPKSLVDLPHLEVLDISNNNLTGEIPRFRSSVKLITAGNPLLRKPASAKGEKNKKVAITLVAFLVTITGAFCIFLTARRTTKQKGIENTITQSKSEAYSRAFSVLLKKESQIKLQDIQIISFEDLVNATDNFHPANNLGQGGFGPVFKGKLRNGQEIAVKRLSNASGQGLEEFMNEVVVISKLQHKHLVQLVGCCITWEEKLLVYEYMPNKSLDAFLFDPNKRKVLDWEKRYNIIIGISHGLLYLHTDSRLRIIHRDIKASNILLDEEFNPKISDFGMARIFDASEEHAKTRRVVGTYGYMPPEYAMEGRFSEKSDVFSFGILLLEIISGRRNTSSDDENGLSLLEYAWNLWNGDSILGLIDPIVLNHNTDQVLRCIHIGLLCVQDLVKDRPKISKVISMLGSEVRLPTPKEPMFLARQITEDHSEPNFNHTKSYIKENDIRHDASLIILEDK